MTDSDRRFLRLLLIVAGPLFVVGGFLAAFTVIGAMLVFAGLGMLAAGLLLFTRLAWPLAALAGVAVLVALTVAMVVDLESRS